MYSVNTARTHKKTLLWDYLPAGANGAYPQEKMKLQAIDAPASLQIHLSSSEVLGDFGDGSSWGGTKPAASSNFDGKNNKTTFP